MRIAIIGSGISGLVCAHHLHRDHDITVYEANDYIGGHTATMDVEVAGQAYAIDTGFIVYNDWTYPNFIALMDELGVEREATRMSFSVNCTQTGLEYCGSSLNALYAQRSNLLRPGFHAMLANIVRFNRDARALLDSNDNPSLGEFLDRGGYGQRFERHYLLPMGAAIWSGSVNGLRAFPARHFARFFSNHGLLNIRNRPQWRVISGGSRSYIAPLTKPFRDSIRLNQKVVSISRNQGRVSLLTETGSPEMFDGVIFACHSDQALAILDDPSKQEKNILAAIPYQDNEVVLHTDRSLLPQRELARACWNYRLTGDDERPATVTYSMNRLQNIDAPFDFCVTLNQTADINPDSILGQYTYAHPFYSLESMRARERRSEINGVNATWYCGAYWDYGFHEDGVRSGLEVVAAIQNELQEAA